MANEARISDEQLIQINRGGWQMCPILSAHPNNHPLVAMRHKSSIVLVAGEEKVSGGCEDGARKRWYYCAR